MTTLWEIMIIASLYAGTIIMLDRQIYEDKK